MSGYSLMASDLLFILKDPTFLFSSPKLLFVLLVPEAATERHLQLLSELAQMFSDRTLRDSLHAAPDAGTLHEAIRQWNTI